MENKRDSSCESPYSENIWVWSRSCASGRKRICGEVLGLDIDEIFRTALGGDPYKHQRVTAEALLKGNSVLMRAPCGSGKTEACVLPFLLERSKGLPSRLIYSLPTRALTDDIAERIVEKANRLGSNAKIAVQHGASSKDPNFEADLIVATIDQTIGAYCATPLSLPAYLGNIPAGAATSSMLCFDEVHTYDHLLGLQSMLILVQRAQNLHLPTVIMSATLPDVFVEYFAKRGFMVVNGVDEDVPKRRDRKVTLYWTGKRIAAQDILEKVKNGRRIMVVCNTVDKAQKIYEEIEGKVSHIFLLHSRFLPRDRKQTEEKMKAHFRNRKPGCLVTTQVCEVGLDISCDIMLTEISPPDSLIQRLGRCARDGCEGTAYVFDVENPAPYEEGLVENCKKYVIENWNGKIIGWSEELNIVNSLLTESFEGIMKNEGQRWKILDSLAEAAFRGDKAKVEQNVREILNVNITIHECPSSLGNDILKMPWLSLDVRLLRRELNHGVKFWSVKWSDDERGRAFPTVTPALGIEPYGQYVVHPNFASYDRILGFVFSKTGHNLTLTPPQESGSVVQIEYHKETWVEHAMKCLSAFEEICLGEKSVVELLSAILGSEYKTTCGIVAYAVGLHDIGKLNQDWQKSIGATDTPLAHIPFSTRVHPPHATVSGFALQEAFQGCIKRRSARLAMALAIGHHHHTRAEEVNAYCFVPDWRNLVEQVSDRVAHTFGTGFDINTICSSSGPSLLGTRFPPFEDTRMYALYCGISRLIRLSDRRSFKIKDVGVA